MLHNVIDFYIFKQILLMLNNQFNFSIQFYLYKKTKPIKNKTRTPSEGVHTEGVYSFKQDFICKIDAVLLEMIHINISFTVGLHCYTISLWLWRDLSCEKSG